MEQQFMDQVDSLEGWVAIKDHPFLEKCAQKKKLVFHVAWNEIEGRIAVTCRHRPNISEPASATAWTGAFTLNELRAIHEQLSLVHPSLGQYLPQLPSEPHGLWAYVLHVEPPDESFCTDVARYLDTALDICGEWLLIDTLFEEHSFDEYFENISELKRRAYDDAVSRAEEQLESVCFLCEGSINMLDMAEVYKQEDEVLFKWNIAWAELYNYLIQPFLDTRELACAKLREAKVGLENQALGARRKAEYETMLTEWRDTYIHALDRIQELYLEYYERTVALLTESKNRMLAHKKTFGAKSFESIAFERFVRVCDDLSAEKLQLLHNRKKHFMNQRDKIKQQIASLEEFPCGVRNQLAVLEHEAYEWQLKIFDATIDLLTEEEQRIRSSVDALKQKIAAEADELHFYDAVENPDELEPDYLELNLQKPTDPRLNRLQIKLRSICQRKAAIRNKKKALVQEKHLQVQKKTEEEERIRKHHTIQLKRAEQKAELKQKQEFISVERKKALDRLKQYKMKYVVPRTLKPPRYHNAESKQTKPSGPSSLMPVSRRSPNKTTIQSPVDTDTTDFVDSQPKSLLIFPSEMVEFPPPPSHLPPPLPPALAPLSPPPPPLPPPGPPPCLPAANMDVRSHLVRSSGSKNEAVTESLDLTAIEAGHLRLRKTETRASASTQLVSMQELMQQRKRLRPVRRDDTADALAVSVRADTSDDHIRILRDALKRIKKASGTDDEDEADEDQDPEEVQDFSS